MQRVASGGKQSLDTAKTSIRTLAPDFRIQHPQSQLVSYDHALYWHSVNSLSPFINIQLSSGSYYRIDTSFRQQLQPFPGTLYAQPDKWISLHQLIYFRYFLIAVIRSVVL